MGFCMSLIKWMHVVKILITLAVSTIAVAAAVVDRWPLVGVNLLYPQGDPQQKKVKVHIKSSKQYIILFKYSY